LPEPSGTLLLLSGATFLAVLGRSGTLLLLSGATFLAVLGRRRYAP